MMENERQEIEDKRLKKQGKGIVNENKRHKMDIANRNKYCK